MVAGPRIGFSVPTNIGRGSFISSGTSLDLVLLCMTIAETNTIIRMATVIFVIELFMIVPVSKDSEYALFVFKVHTNHLLLEQSIVAIIYDESGTYFGIGKRFFPGRFYVKFVKSRVKYLYVFGWGESHPHPDNNNRDEAATQSH